MTTQGARARRSHAWLVAILLAVFFAPALFTSLQFVYRDNGRMHAPMKRWIAEELRHGRLPQWNPYSGLGTPVLGNGIDAVLHPFNLLLVALPEGVGFKAWVLLSLALAAAGGYVWARTLTCSPRSAAVAALAFGLSGPLVSSSDNVTYLTTYAALPWLFAAVHAFVARGGPRRLALVAAASLVCAAGGDPQAWGIAVGLAPVYAFVVAGREARATAARRGSAAAIAMVAAAAPVVLPIAAWIPYSARATGLDPAELTRWNLHPHRLLELAVPGLFRSDWRDPVSPVFQAYCGNDVTPLPWFLSVYLGSSTLALALVGAARDRLARWAAGGALLFVWAALGPNAGFGQLAAHLPIVGTFRFWEKVGVWAALLLALAAARGVDALVADGGGRRVARTAGLLALLAGLLALTAAFAPWTVLAAAGGPPAAAARLAENLASGALHAAAVLVAVALLALLDPSRLGRLAPYAFLLLVGADLMAANGQAYLLDQPAPASRPALARGLPPTTPVLSPFRAREDRWPELGRLAGTWEWSRRTLMASWNVPLRLRSPHDYVGLREGRWSRLRQEVADGGAVARLGLFGFAALVVPGDPALASSAGVRHPGAIIGHDPELPAWLVEIPHRPRAYVAQRVVGVDPPGALAYAVGGGEADLTVVEGRLPEEPLATSGRVELVHDLPGELTLQVAVAARALVVLNDAWAPGWSAWVDGQPVGIERANWAARGVWVPAGEHRVRFSYTSPGLAAGCALASALASLLGGWALLRRWRARRERA